MDFEVENIRGAMKETVYKATIDEIQKLVAGETEPKEVFKICISHVVDASQAVAGTFWLYKKDMELLFPYVVVGGEDLSGIVLSSKEGVAGNVATTGKAQLIDNLKRSDNWSEDTDARTGFKSESMICVPVRCYGEVFGCLQLLNHKFNGYFEEKDLQFTQELVDGVINRIIDNNLIEKLSKQNGLNFGRLILTRNVEALFELLDEDNIDEVLSAINMSSRLSKWDQRRKKEFLNRYKELWEEFREKDGGFFGFRF